MILVQITDINETLRDADFKDERPLKTVEKIKGILKNYGIETEERWMDSGVPYCYSLRITVSGTTFGTNGKGLTKEFALASGYGELMERLQLGYVGSVEVQKDGNYSVNDSQDEILSAEELLQRNRNWYEALSELTLRYTGDRVSPEEILMRYADSQGKVQATPFYNISKGEKAYIPTQLRKCIYTTNGCAAGNTMEEAIVQGISEIVERHHQMKILTERITVPDVPEDELRKYEAAYSIISYVRSKGFRVIIKDCSLGIGFPVICACFVDGKNGKYHTHFGAYPIFEIALERALTETFQGRNIASFAIYDDFIYRKSDVYSLNIIESELVRGRSKKLPEFFLGQMNCKWNPDVGFTGGNNRELMRECVDFFAKQGYDVLIRNASCLGFPTFQIMVPGYSEVFVHRMSNKHDNRRYAAFARKALRNPSAAGTEDILGLLMHINQMGKVSNDIAEAHGFLASAQLSAKPDKKFDGYLMAASLAYVYYSLGKYAETVKCIDSMIAQSDRLDMEYLVCVKRYLSLLLSSYDKEQIRQILTYFHREESVEKLWSCLEKKRNPLDEFTLHCDMLCQEGCLLYETCCQKRVGELTKMINSKTKELDFEAFAQSLTQLLQE